MANEQLQRDIMALIQKNGPMGVNSLATELNIPLSTMQRYLDKQQTYFKRNHSRKWALPEDAANEDMSAIAADYSNIIDSQLLSIDALFETIMSQFRATTALIQANKGARPSVADKVDPQLQKLDKNVKDAYAVFKKYSSKIPEEYQELIINVDLYRLTIELGTNFVNSEFNSEISALMLEKSTELSDETLKLLEEYQK